MKVKALIVAGLLVGMGITPAVAGVWEAQCAGCHNGSMAPSKAQLKAKFKDAKAFVEAGLKSTNPMMSAFKNNLEPLKEAAKEIYGK
ncbi:hypothetical protein [Desulfurobacterium sp.]|uniref:hypothetical protein n=1 Tax=Desulfurobacterium sp. TaxID=2004706 RepID=UPI002607236C|nr:hypothetical protein [Desulfurobacterium sp.]